MTKRHYTVNFAVEVLLDVDEEVIERIYTPEFGSIAYDGMTEEDAVEMLARCLGIYGLSIRHLDGWSDLGEDAAYAVRSNIELVSWELTREEDV